MKRGSACPLRATLLKRHYTPPLSIRVIAPPDEGKDTTIMARNRRATSPRAAWRVFQPITGQAPPKSDKLIPSSGVLVMRRARLTLSACFSIAALCAASSLALAQDMRIPELRFSDKDMSVVFYNLNTKDSSLSEAQWRTALTSNDSTQANALLLQLNAARVTFEKIEINIADSETKTKMVLNQVDFATIKNGVAATGAMGRSEIRMDAGTERQTISLESLVLRQAALGLPTKTAQGPLPLALQEGVMEDVRIDHGPNAAASIKTIKIENLRAAALDDKVTTVLRLIGDRDFSDLSPLEKSAGAKALNELFHSFSFGRIAAEDIVDRDGKDRTQIRLMVYEGGAKNRFAIEGLESRMNNETTRIGAIVFDDFSFEPTISAALAALAAKDGQEPPVANFLPRLGSFAIKDLNVSGSKVSGYGGDAALQSLTIAFDNPMGGTPTGLRLSFAGLSAAIDKNDPSAAELLALGYQTIDASGTLDMKIEKARDVLTFRELSLQMKNIGTVHLTGSVGGIAAVMDAKDSDEAALAGLGLTVHALGIGIANDGLFERVMAKTAKDTGKAPEQVKREMTSLAALGLPGLIGSSPQAKAISSAALQFLNKPERIVFALKAKSPDGLGLADLIGIASADDLFAQTDITAQAGR